MDGGRLAWARAALVGYVPVLFTPYRHDGKIDYEALQRDIDYILQFDHVAGLYVGSIYQEFWTLSTKERLELARHVVEYVDSRTVVMVSATSLEAQVAHRLAEDAIGHGADMIMLWPPFFGPRGVNESVEFMTGILDAVDAPFAVYNSGLAEVGFQLPIDVLRDLASHRNVVAVKEASLRLDVFLETVVQLGEAALVSSPLEEYWLAGRHILGPAAVPDLLLGSSRFLWAQTRDAPVLCELFRWMSSDEHDRGRAILHALLPALTAIHSTSLNSGVHPVGLLKRLRGRLGQSGGDPRNPIPSVHESQVETALRILASAGVRPDG